MSQGAPLNALDVSSEPSDSFMITRNTSVTQFYRKIGLRWDYVWFLCHSTLCNHMNIHFIVKAYFVSRKITVKCFAEIWRGRKIIVLCNSFQEIHCGFRSFILLSGATLAPQREHQTPWHKFKLMATFLNVILPLCFEEKCVII